MKNIQNKREFMNMKKMLKSEESLDLWLDMCIITMKINQKTITIFASLLL